MKCKNFENLSSNKEKRVRRDSRVQSSTALNINFGNLVTCLHLRSSISGASGSSRPGGVSKNHPLCGFEQVFSTTTPYALLCSICRSDGSSGNIGRPFNVKPSALLVHELTYILLDQKMESCISNSQQLTACSSLKKFFSFFFFEKSE